MNDKYIDPEATLAQLLDDPTLELELEEISNLLATMADEESATLGYRQNLPHRVGTAADIGIDMVPILGDLLTMGENDDPRSRPVHRVKVDSFYMSDIPITQGMYYKMLGFNPSSYHHAKHPVTNVSHDEAIEFCNLLTQFSGRRYTLPSEAQWEFACRAGSNTIYTFGNRIDPTLANYSAVRGSNQHTVACKSYQPNAFGLYDLHGNIWEYCHDDWHDNYLFAPVDGSAWVESSARPDRVAIRGGAFNNEATALASHYRQGVSRRTQSRNLGFRIISPCD
jgi:formylglycine-generating enzyme required for sulfatase activity